MQNDLARAVAQRSVDFADPRRIIGSDGTNLRADVDDGKVSKGNTPMTVAGG
jgi:hypothetical protein